MRSPILVLLPSLNRSASLAECVGLLALHGTGQFDVFIIGGPGGGTAAFNSVPMDLVRAYSIVSLMGDDCRVRTPQWDQLVLDRMGGAPGLVYGRDGIKDQSLCTHPFISARIILELGFVQPPELNHFYADNFYMDLLGPLGMLRYVPELVTEHMHFTVGKSSVDSTYQQNAAQWSHDEASWNDLCRHRMEGYRERIRTMALT